jgi:hypothetical protein
LPPYPTTRSRQREGLTLSGRSKGSTVFKNGNVSEPFPPTSVTTRYRGGTQVTVSEGHPWSRNKRPAGDVGGDFYSEDHRVEFDPSGVALTDTTVLFPTGSNPGIRTSYFTGHVAPGTVAGGWSASGGLMFPPFIKTSDDDLDELGTSAIAQCLPTNSVADVGTAVAEIVKEGIPSMIGSQFWRGRTLKARTAGSEYLNVQFGWRPLVNDVRKFTNGVVNADSVLKQYERDAGKVVRRRYNFPTVVSVEETVLHESVPPTMPGANSVFNVSGGRLVRRREKRQNRWFSGAFTYHLPSGYDSRNALDRYALLAARLGGSATPDVLWNVSPWSWMVDWFSNAGDVVHNLHAFQTDGLVMRYGYIMVNTIITDTYTHEGSTFNGKPVTVAPLRLITEIKQRRQANPYGFGLTWDGLSPFQLSILAALGITRGRR